MSGSAQKMGKSTNKGRVHQHEINSKYTESSFQETFSKALKDQDNFTLDDKELIHSSPFTCCTLPSFIKDSQMLDLLQDELFDQIFIDKNNDLYKFQQTDDLKKISSPHIKAIRQFFCGDVLSWMKSVTGLPLSNKVHISCSKYEHTDTLLCHDDELEGRRIAFILYLVPNNWKEQDGGFLDLFKMNEHSQPTEIAKSFLPVRNTLAWFPVTPGSYHQVSEVLSPDKIRLSVNGWFYGPDIERPALYKEPAVERHKHIDITEDKFAKWINPLYLNPITQCNIQEQFEKNSEIELQEFIEPEIFAEVSRALSMEGLNWSMIGPVNKRHYEQLPCNKLPSIVRECLELFQSDAMFLTLSNLTGLKLHELAPEQSDSEESDDAVMEEDTQGCSSERSRPSVKKQRLNSESNGKAATPIDPRCQYEVRRWQHGSYTLVDDAEGEQAEFSLEAKLFSCQNEWEPEFGGTISYIAKGEDVELLTVNPSDNCLALIYRDKETLGFVKHINSTAEQYMYHDIALVYYE